MSKKITLKKIQEIVLASLEKNGVFPSPQAGTTFDEVGFPGEAAGALNSSIRTGGRSLDIDPDWISLRDSLPRGVKPLLSMLDPTNQLTLSVIRKMTEDYQSAHGKFPTALANVSFATSSYPHETSKSINSALKSGARGLNRDPEWVALRDVLLPNARPTLASLDPFHNLTISKIRVMVDTYKAHFGVLPSVSRKSNFADVGFAGETALAIDSSLRIGGRGLDRDPAWFDLRDSLPVDVVPTLASLERLPFLTMSLIQEMTNAFSAKHGFFPSSQKNSTFDDVGYPGEKATSIDSAIGSGGRGLHRDPAWEAFRDKQPQGVRPSLPMLNPFNQLTLDKVREMTGAYLKKYGKFPSGAANSRFDEFGFPGESADSLNSTLRRGGRGLDRDPEWINLKASLNGSSVPTLAMLDPFHNLTINLLKEIVMKSMDLNGKVPATAAKTSFADVGYPDETASSFNSAMRRGGRGLSRDPQWIAMKAALPPGKEPSLSMITAMVVTPAFFARHKTSSN